MKKHTYITDELINQYVTMYHNGKTIVEIGQATNTDPATVSKYLRKNGERVEQISEYKIQIVCDLYLSGLSEEQVGAQVNLCRTTVRRILKRNGIQIRSQEETSKIYPLNEHYFDEIDTQNKAYILGLIYADGNVDNKSKFQISLQERDLHILEEMKKEFGCIERPLVYDKRNDKNSKHMNMYCLHLKNKIFHAGLLKHGVVPNKTHLIQYPQTLSPDLNRHFIRGLLDGDGCIHGTDIDGKFNAHVDIVGTYSICCVIKDIIWKELNIHCSLIKVHNSGYVPYRITISGRLQCLTFLDWLYKDANMFLYRKYETYLKQYKYAA